MVQASQEKKPAGLIAIMGATGTGKSTFINVITGKNTSDVGHSLESQTNAINEYDFQLPNGLVVTLVDTPGFDDYTSDGGGKSDLVILKEIGSYLKKKYDEKRKFSGIFYLYNIRDPKVGGSLQRNMTMFKKLCGDDPLKNVVVVTTFWDEAELEQAEGTERELKTEDKFFKGLVEGGSKFVRHGLFPLDKRPEGSEFQQPLSVVVDLVALDPVFVEMQRELAQGRAVEETSAGAELYKELQQLKLKQKKDVSELNMKIAEMKVTNAKGREMREALENEQRKLRAEMAQGHSDLRNVMATWKKQAEADAKRQSLELEEIRRNELKGNLELLKTLHAKELLECQFQIRSLMDGNSAAEYRRNQLEKTTEDLKGTVCILSLALDNFRETYEKEVIERLQFIRECKNLRASAERWADEEKRLSQGWEEARSSLEPVKSDLRRALSTQERMTVELKDSQETVARVNSQLMEVHSTKATLLADLKEARSKVTQLNEELDASRKAQEKVASELLSQTHAKVSELDAAFKALADTQSTLANVQLVLTDTKSASEVAQAKMVKELQDAHLELQNAKSELTSCKRQNAQMESQLKRTKSELAAASSNASLLQEAESDLDQVKADLHAAQNQLVRGKPLLSLIDAPAKKLPVISIPLSFPLQPYRFIKNVVVKSFTSTDAAEDGFMKEMGGRSSNINNGLGGEAVYLYPQYTFNFRKAISSFSLRLQDECDPSKTDLAEGCSKPYRYLDSDSDPDSLKITDISLFRSSSSQNVLEGWDGMFDLNEGRGTAYLYLAWKTIPTSVTIVLPHRFVKDIVVDSFDVNEEVKPGYLKEKNGRSSNVNEGFNTDFRVYLYPRYTVLYEEAISGFSLRLQDSADKSKTDLASGVPGQFRYLDIEYDSDDSDAGKICDVMLIRGIQRDLPQGWDGMCDLNRSRGRFLYLVWKVSQ